jgi:hypothetical protein
MVGPGSYRDNHRAISAKKIRGGRIYKQWHRERPVENNAYYMIGNHVVYDPELMTAKRKQLGAVDTSGALTGAK